WGISIGAGTCTRPEGMVQGPSLCETPQPRKRRAIAFGFAAERIARSVPSLNGGGSERSAGWVAEAHGSNSPVAGSNMNAANAPVIIDSVTTFGPDERGRAALAGSHA